MKHVKTITTLVACLICIHTIAQVRYYASNRVLNAINTYEEDGTYIEEFIEKDAGGLSNPQDIILHPENFLLVTGTNNTRIKKFDLETGEYLGDWSDEVYSLAKPSKMSIGPDDLIYVTQWGTTQSTSKIVRFDLEGNYLGPFTPSAPQGLGHVWDEDGNFYLALFGLTSGSGTIRKYDVNGDFVEIFIDSAVLENPTYIWWDENGDMLVQDFTAGKVLRYDSNGNYISDFITGLANPEGFTYLPNGNLLISERGANQVTEFDSNGTLIGPWSNGGTLAGPNFIEAIEIPDLGIDENSLTQKLLISTVGTYFEIQSALVGELQQIEIYSRLGMLIDTMTPTHQAVWEASNVANGIYFMKGLKYDGTILTQKLVVKK